MQTRLWQPGKERIANANICRFMTLVREQTGLDIDDYPQLYRWSIDSPADFWRLFWQFADIKAETRGERIVVDPQRLPGAQWFPDARLNYAENLLKPAGESPERIAISFHDEQGTYRRISYRALYRAVAQLAKAMQQDGVRAGDRVAAVLPNRPEAVIAMLATASLGAVWSSCSPDFGVPGIVDRFGQIEAKWLLLCDGYYFNGKRFDCREQRRSLCKLLPTVERRVTVQILSDEFTPVDAADISWCDYLAGVGSVESIVFRPMAFADPLAILYSSGTTGPPKCIVHGVGGTLIQHLKEHRLHVDVHPGDRIFYYTTCGWMMWNWLVGALASAATLVLYDGAPLYPTPAYLFDLIDRERINVFGVSAKYLDALNKAGLNPKRSHRLDSLQTILSTGSPLSPDGFGYVYRSIKTDVCLSSISGGTDIISCFVLGCPILPVYAGEIQCRGLGMKVDVFDEHGQSIKQSRGELVCTASFPSMPIGFWNDPDRSRYYSAYFQRYPGVWCHGDYVELTEHGGMIVYGRSDTVLNPGGVRIGAAEIYRPVEQLDAVLESLVVGQQYQNDCRVLLFLRLRDGVSLDAALQERIKRYIRKQASPRHVPALLFQVDDIPRTRSGKIVESAVADIVNRRPVNNEQSLANPHVLAQYRRIVERLHAAERASDTQV